jgi:protein-tyrosine phosphatase
MTDMSKNKKYKILFVCLGNICRSPAAQTVMQHLVDERGLGDCFILDSAGTYGGHAGWHADSRMLLHASRRGYRITHLARQVRSYDFDDFDMIVGMDASNVSNLRRLAPTLESESKIMSMGKYIDRRLFPGIDYVPDPYYSGSDGFELVLDLLEDACATLLNDIINNQNISSTSIHDKD